MFYICVFLITRFFLLYVFDNVLVIKTKLMSLRTVFILLSLLCIPERNFIISIIVLLVLVLIIIHIFDQYLIIKKNSMCVYQFAEYIIVISVVVIVRKK